MAEDGPLYPLIALLLTGARASAVMEVLDDSTPLTDEERGPIPDSRASPSTALGDSAWEDAPTIRYVPGTSSPAHNPGLPPRLPSGKED